MIRKILRSAADALNDVADGDPVGSFGTAREPNELAGTLLAAGRVREIICNFPRQAGSHLFERL